MSLQRDYLLRMIEMMGDLIAALMGKIKKGDVDKANEQLEQIYTDFLKKDAAFFRSLPLEGLTEKLLNEHNYTNDHLLILAELFYAEAELQAARANKPESIDYYKKALLLFEFIDAAYKTYDEKRLQKMKSIHEILIKFTDNQHETL